jgi:hypothetical protein
MGAITVEDGDMVVLKDDRRRRLLVGAAMMCECMLCEIRKPNWSLSGQWIPRKSMTNQFRRNIGRESMSTIVSMGNEAMT